MVKNLSMQKSVWLKRIRITVPTSFSAQRGCVPIDDCESNTLGKLRGGDLKIDRSENKSMWAELCSYMGI